eukprot:5534604-Prymnesium_polylepis.1
MQRMDAARDEARDEARVTRRMLHRSTQARDAAPDAAPDTDTARAGAGAPRACASRHGCTGTGSALFFAWMGKGVGAALTLFAFTLDGFYFVHACACTLYTPVPKYRTGFG